MRTKCIESFDKKQIHCCIWDKVENPIGVVQLIHGMKEHVSIYHEFAKFLNSHGYIVFGDDHRAHGKTAESVEKLGQYDEGNLFYDTLRDEMFFSDLLKEQYKDLPLYVFGTGYGSYIIQSYIQKYHGYDKVILCGTNCMKSRYNMKLGKFISKLTLEHKYKNINSTIEKRLIGRYNKKVKKGSYINSDPVEAAKYYADEYCNVPFSAKFYYDFYSGLIITYNKEKLQDIDRKKPILLISGKQDPIGNLGKNVVKLFKLYNENDLNVQMKLYDNARQMILHEPAVKETVMNDILKFLQAKDTDNIDEYIDDDISDLI